MPAPQEEETPAEVTFKCPQCGAPTGFDIREGGLSCPHCGYFAPPKEKIVGKAAEQSEFTLSAVQAGSPTNGWGEDRNELSCQQCGAVVTVPVENLTHTCPFCGSNKVIQRQADQGILRPKFLIPFKVKPDVCKAIAHQWLGSSWMTPSSLQQVAAIGAFTPIFLPFWTFTATCDADWRAEVGHDRTETYYENGERKTRTVTDWRWKNGNVRNTYHDLLISGTKRHSLVLLNRLKSYDLDALTPYAAEFLAGMHAQAYDIPLEEAWESGREQMRESSRQACLRDADGDHIRNFSMSLDFEDESWRYILVPMYSSVFQYQSKPYQILVNGQNGAITGPRPADWNKIWLVMAAIAAPGLLVSLIGLITAVFGIGLAIGGIGLVLLIIAVIIDVIIFSKAKEMEHV